MKYAKQVMKKSELLKMGFSSALLDKAYMDRNQSFAWKIDPSKKNSPIEFDTDGFNRWLENHKRIDRASIHF